MMPSSAIRFHRYGTDKRTLLIVFTSGRRYVYRGVPLAVAQDLDAAESRGAYFNTDIRDRFDYDEITR